MMRNTLKLALLASSSLLLVAASENKPGWKLDADGKIEMKDGNPIWINAAGQEQTMNGDTIANLNAEAKSHRTRAEKAEGDLKKYEGLDPEAARKAVEMVGKLDAKQLIDAGEVDKVREAVKGEFTGLLTEAQKRAESLEQQYQSLQIDNIFNGSDFLRNDVAIPRDMFQASMRNNFKFVDGKIVALDKAGNQLMSKDRVGEYATPDEALRLLVDMHPQKDAILRAPDAGGSGNNGGGGGRGPGKTIKRADFDNLEPGQQAQLALKGEVAIVD